MIDNYILYKNLPTLDLHGENRYSAIVLTEEFINNNLKLGNKLIVIIHGIGEGILKENIHKFLKTKKGVKSYKTDIFNPGTTIVELF
ncbi:MAG: Smr/MutS family protein [Bacilli bacterium]